MGGKLGACSIWRVDGQFVEIDVVAIQHAREKNLQHTMHWLTHSLIMHTSIYSYNQLSVHSWWLGNGNPIKRNKAFGLLICTHPTIHICKMLSESRFCMCGLEVWFMSNVLVSLLQKGDVQLRCCLSVIIGRKCLTFVDSQATLLVSPHIHACLTDDMKRYVEKKKKFFTLERQSSPWFVCVRLRRG